MHVGGHQEGKEQRDEFRHRDLFHPAVHRVVDAAAGSLLLFLQLREQLPDEPLKVARGGGGGFLDQVVARKCEAGIHLHSAVDHRFLPDVFVDGPGPGDHADLRGIRHACGDGAGINVEHTADDRRSRLQSALRRCLLGHVTADLSGPAGGRKRVLHLGDPVHVQELLVKIHGPEIHQAGAGVVRHLRPGFPGQAEADVVLALEHILDVRVAFRLVVPEPREQRCGLARHDMLQRAVEGHFLHAVGFPLQRIAVGAVVRGDDAVPRRLVILAPEVQTLSVAGNADAGNIARVNACLLQNALQHRTVRVPHFFHVTFHKARLRSDRPGGNAAGADLPAALIKDRRLGRGSAVVEPDKIAHLLFLLSVVVSGCVSAPQCFNRNNFDM